jgi:hypothetical protein
MNSKLVQNPADQHADDSPQRLRRDEISLTAPGCLFEGDLCFNCAENARHARRCLTPWRRYRPSWRPGRRLAAPRAGREPSRQSGARSAAADWSHQPPPTAIVGNDHSRRLLLPAPSVRPTRSIEITVFRKAPLRAMQLRSGFPGGVFNWPTVAELIARQQAKQS